MPNDPALQHIDFDNPGHNSPIIGDPSTYTIDWSKVNNKEENKNESVGK